jgi:hypothetical protein
MRILPKPRKTVYTTRMLCESRSRRRFLRRWEVIDLAGAGGQLVIIIGLGTLGDGYEFPEDGVFEFEFDTICDRFKYNLDGVVADEFDHNDGNIEEEDNNIDCEELMEDYVVSAVGSESEEFHRFPDIDSRDDQFLDVESYKLDVFHYAVST